jgi:hypothetical protein
MNLLHIPILVLIMMIPALRTGSQVMEHENLYPFEGKFIDLDELEIVLPAGSVDDNFKVSSKYAFRFSAPSDWMNNFSREVKFGQSVFELNDEGVLKFYSQSNSSGEEIDRLGKDQSLDNVVGSDFLVSVNGGVIRLSRLEENQKYLLKKYDAGGRLVYEKMITHTDITVEGNTYYHHPYLYYFGCTPDYLIFTSNDSKYPKTVTVKLADGSITNYEFTIAGFIRDEDESNVPGFVIIDRDKEQINTLLINLSWKAAVKGNWYNRAEILMKGEILYISLYHGISTGSSLYAYNRSSGELLWQAEVKQLNIPHSEYYNTVFLSSYKNKIILEGVEAGGHYVQIFDEKTGARLYSTF